LSVGSPIPQFGSHFLQLGIFLNIYRSEAAYFCSVKLNKFLKLLKMSIMNKIFSCFVAVVAAGVMNVHAQGVDVGVKGGLTIPNLLPAAVVRIRL
jgi:hypothetical protein